MIIPKSKFRSVIVNRLFDAKEGKRIADDMEYSYDSRYYEGKVKALEQLLDVLDNWEDDTKGRK